MSEVGDTLAWTAEDFPAEQYFVYGDSARIAGRFARQIAAAGLSPMGVALVVTRGMASAIAEVWVAPADGAGGPSSPVGCDFTRVA